MEGCLSGLTAFSDSFEGERWEGEISFSILDNTNSEWCAIVESTVAAKSLRTTSLGDLLVVGHQCLDLVP